MKAREELTRDSLRMALAAVQAARVSGDASHDLSDDDVLAILRREVKKRHESAEIYAAASRPELADREVAEATVLEAYLPQQLGDDAVAELVAAAIAQTGATSSRDMGTVMRAAKKQAGNEVDGKRLSTEVSRQLRS